MEASLTLVRLCLRRKRLLSVCEAQKKSSLVTKKNLRNRCVQSREHAPSLDELVREACVSDFKFLAMPTGWAQVRNLQEEGEMSRTMRAELQGEVARLQDELELRSTELVGQPNSAMCRLCSD